jgi:hypothetical protein
MLFCNPDYNGRALRRLTLLLSLLLLAGLPRIANAGLIQFEQDGWSLGGPLRVVFQGSDTDGDGTLVLTELSDFEAVWKTPDTGEVTSWRLPDIVLDGFFFTNLENYLFAVENTEFSLVNVAFEGEALASVFDESLFLVASTSSLPTPVPEPSTCWLLATGGIAVLVGKWWRHRRPCPQRMIDDISEGRRGTRP